MEIWAGRRRSAGRGLPARPLPVLFLPPKIVMTGRSDEAGNGSVHIPVLPDEVASHLNAGMGGVVVDATVGAGGHAGILLASSPDDTVLIGLDRDSEILEIARENLACFGERARLFHSPFARLDEVVRDAGYDHVDRILFDLGLSSFALDTGDRGFSMMLPGPLDMRMDRSAGDTAAEVIKRSSKEELSDLIYKFGEDRYSRRIAGAIVRARQEAPIETTTRLAQIVARAVPRKGRNRLHPATRTFQALRIAVNRELDQLREGLEAASAILAPGGRVGVISFHSLEDRIVKLFFRERLDPVVKKPIRPSRDEVLRNRRARSARFRVASRSEKGEML